MSKESELQKLREEIDSADNKLLTLINERARLATIVAEIKRADSEQVEYYRPEREAQVLREIIKNNPGPLDDLEVARLFREIMSACLALEQKLEIAFLGPAATFTQAAALKHFGHAVNTNPQTSIADVFRIVESGVCHYGVVPIENSTEGSVNQTLDLLISSSLKICGEVQLPIHHNLMSPAESLAEIKKVWSHEQSLAQCRSWLDKNLPNVERIAISSNAEAAMTAIKDITGAAIAGSIAAEHYKLPILEKNIEDEPDNTTRFLIIGQNNARASGQDKSSILFANANVPGALQKSLACFADNNINMSRIESRPSKHGMWEYVFFVDVEGHADDSLMQKVLEDLKQHTLMIKVLGSYPHAPL
ncbi:MAG: prephenate dehydratase [Gammaproteobacteria bacterium]|nr:prephenate dehydratase [Gammaproteobacteria bacterium]